jgi:hypothetical protein
MPPVLETRGLVNQFVGIVATDDVSLSIEKTEDSHASGA